MCQERIKIPPSPWMGFGFLSCWCKSLWVCFNPHYLFCWSYPFRHFYLLRRLALGHTNREIARACHISIKTVDTYRSRLLKKLNLRNNAELSRFAIQNRLIEPWFRPLKVTFRLAFSSLPATLFFVHITFRILDFRIRISGILLVL